MNFIASNILYLRKRKGVTQAEICAQLGFVRNTFSNWENNLSTPDVDTLAQLSDYFDVNLSDFIRLDLSEGNLTEKDNSRKKQPPGNPKDNLRGNPYTQNEQLLSMVKEAMVTYVAGEKTSTELAKTVELQQTIIKSQEQTINALQKALELASGGNSGK